MPNYADKMRLLEELRGRISSLEQNPSCDSSRSSQNAFSERRNRLSFADDSFDEFENSDQTYSPKAVKGATNPDAFRRIERLCSTRYRSERQIRDRLIRENFTAAEIDAAVNRARRCLLLDDERYADTLIRSRVRSGKGVAGIAYELKSEGIDPQSVPGWPHEYIDDSSDAQYQRAIEILNAKPPRAKNVTSAAYRKLVQKGYHADVAMRAARDFAKNSHMVTG